MAIAMGRGRVDPQAAGKRHRPRLAAVVAHGADGGGLPAIGEGRRAVAPGAIALDEVSAGLLDARFDVSETDAGLVDPRRGGR